MFQASRFRQFRYAIVQQRNTNDCKPWTTRRTYLGNHWESERRPGNKTQRAKSELTPTIQDECGDEKFVRQFRLFLISIRGLNAGSCNIRDLDRPPSGRGKGHEPMVCHLIVDTRPQVVNRKGGLRLDFSTFEIAAAPRKTPAQQGNLAPLTSASLRFRYLCTKRAGIGIPALEFSVSRSFRPLNGRPTSQTPLTCRRAVRRLRISGLPALPAKPRRRCSREKPDRRNRAAEWLRLSHHPR